MKIQKNTKKTGATLLLDALQRHGVKYIFGHPGGAAIPIFDALVDTSLEFILARHEQGATHMADGYARATGNIGTVLVTSGPGATNTVTGLLTSHMDSVPLLVITGQQIRSNLGLDAFQEADVLGITFPVVKHSYLIKDPYDIPRIMEEAFYIAHTGRPGPVLIDVPKDVSAFVFEHTDIPKITKPEMDIPGYTITMHTHSHAIQTAADILNNAQKPLILAGHGSIIAEAQSCIVKFAEKQSIPVTNTLLGKGAFPETHALSLGMLGMHGTAYANLAVNDCDVIISLGSRWDDRITSKTEVFCKNAKKIHVDIDNAEFEKILPMDCIIHANIKDAVIQLLPLLTTRRNKAWLAKISDWKKQFPLKVPESETLIATKVLKDLYDVTKGQAIVSTDVGQHQMWTAQFYLIQNEKQWLTSGGAGTMGFGLPAAIGAQFAHPDALVVAVVGDGGFQMTLCELATIVENKLRVKILILNNSYLGMVRQWQSLFFDNRLSGVHLTGNPDFVAIAQSYGIKGIRISSPENCKDLLREAIQYEGPCLIDARVRKEEDVYPMIPAGASYDRMLTEATDTKLTKPVGST